MTNVSKNRRDIIKLGVGACLPVLSGGAFARGFDREIFQDQKRILNAKGQWVSSQTPPEPASKFPKPNVDKVKYFHKDFDDDIFLSVDQAKIVASLFQKLRITLNHVGFGRFNVIGLDTAIKYNKSLGKRAAYTKAELDYLESLFEFDARYYGFFGEKVVSKLSANFQTMEVKKIPYTGHYLFKGEATELYDKLQKKVGRKLVLTSGVRGVIKQTYLFLNKLRKVNGNLSKASRSLAPPGYSFHGIGDFDVGTRGLGAANFTSRFAKTKEYKKLLDMGYVKIRYEEENSLGVRYEPWHIKVV